MFVIVTRNFPPSVGGMQSLMGDLALNFSKYGPVKVFADASEESDSFDKKQPYSVERVGGIKLLQKYRKNNQVELFCSKHKGIRAIISDHWKSIEKISHNICAQIPTLCLIHGKEINHTKGSLSNTRRLSSLKKATYVIANSEFTKKLAISKGVKADKIKVINPGIFPSKKISKKIITKAANIFGKSSPKLISVTRLVKRKGLHSVILSLKNLQAIYPKFLYVILGSGEQAEQLRSLTNNMGLENNIIFLEKTSIELKNALLNQSDIFLMPSIQDGASVEGFGISFLEASMFKTACIGGKIGGASDIIKHGVTGFLCDGEDQADIYDALVKMMKKDLYKKMGVAAQAYSKNFIWKTQIKKYLKLI